ncbi:reducing type I polyketide synthase [Decorospora gaudefroyi]|uniref:Reducing type I polyketide synthase n=1 Tax=Decorospora gaudefroyi TaxID=184978 RepID=A0A6A5K4E7_9PLEO|nr:reducing type I polyketide synthase [Decorospora gaudefroyi]
MTIKSQGPWANGTHGTPTNGGNVMSDPKRESLAIVGMACRFAGDATSPEKLWDLVSQGRDAWSTVPGDRFNQQAFFHPQSDLLSTMSMKGGFFLREDPGAFDTSFFNLSAEVAAAMDPQIRIQLEIVFEALESAGIPLSSVVGSNTAVFTGSFTKDYHDLQLRDPLKMSRAFVTGNYAAMLANHVSHFFDLKGPSVAVDTGCSTSLMGLHFAAQSLRDGDSDCAIVGGACLNLNPDAFVNLSTLQTCGPDGKCYAFDARAQGYGRGDGVAAIVLKRLSAAIRDGDVIRAIVRETAANQDGHTPTITAPNSDVQRNLIAATYARARLNPLDTAVVEAHGTGTRVGDPAEARAIGEAMGRGRDNPLYVGSVKTNLGHTEAASGLAAVIKMVLALEHREIPPSLNFEKANPEIDLPGLGLLIPTKLQVWRSKGPRRVSINNFGYGGTNTHVIMEEAPAEPVVSNTRGQLPSHQLFLLSARHKNSTQQMAADLKRYLESSGEKKFLNASAFADLAYTLTERRTRFPWTLAVSASRLADLVKALEESTVQNSPSSDRAPRLGFVFNGQGAQWYAMGRELSASYPVYQHTLKECDEIIQSFGADWSLLAELERSQETSQVNEVMFSMSLTCAVQLALVRLLHDFGIEPAAVTGHSSGEIAAAFAAGALTLHDAMAATYFRGFVTAHHLSTAAQHTPGGMLAVGVGASDAKPYVDAIATGRVVIACENSPSSITLSGDMAGIEELAAKFTSQGIFVRKLVVQTAFHSHHMMPLQKKYRAALEKHMAKQRKFKEKDVLFMSPVTGTKVEDAISLGPEHWVQNMTDPVLFHDSFRNMVATEHQDGKMAQNVDVIVEIGPHSALAGPIRQCLKSLPLKGFSVSYAACLERGKDAVLTMQGLAGFLVSRGYPVNTSHVNTPNGQQGLQVVPGLPSYAWNHTQRFWHESRISNEHRFRKHPQHDLLGLRLTGTSDRSPIWRQIVRSGELPWVRDHVVQGDMVFPGAGYITMAIEAMRQLHSSESAITGYLLEEIEILRATVIPEDNEGVELQLFLEPVSEKALHAGKRVFRIYAAASDGAWAEAARGYITVDLSSTRSNPTLRSTREINMAALCRGVTVPKAFYESLATVGIKHGQSFQALVAIRKGGDDQSLSTLVVPDSAAQMPYNWQQPHVIHPITLDAVFQAAYTALSTKARNTVGAAVPRFVKSLFISPDISPEPGTHLRASSRILHYHQQGFDASLAVRPSQSTDNHMVIEVDTMRFRSVGAADSDSSDAPMKICAFEEWVPSVQLNQPHGMFDIQLQRAADPNEISLSQELTRAAYHLITDAMALVTQEDVAQLEWYHTSLYRWMQLQLQLAMDDKLAPRSSKWARATPGAKAALLDRVAGASTNGALTVRVGRNLLAILRKEVAPLEVMLKGGLLYQFYREMLHFTESTKQLAEIARAITRERPRARILEIGAGTGGCTGPVLTALGGEGVIPASFEHYTFTDISSGFFQAARDRFAAFGDLLSYQPLNIEQDPAQQGFTEKYDLIIAAQVLHATKKMSVTMHNVRKLLKDDGKLLMVETTRDTVDGHFIFGTLPGWWLSEEPERRYSPNMSLQQWRPILENAGFTGIDLDIWDCEDEEHRAMSVIMSTAIPEEMPTYDTRVALVYDTPELSLDWLRGLAQKVKDFTGSAPEITGLNEVNIQDKLCIFLSGLNGMAMKHDEHSFDSIKTLATKSKGLLWVTTGSAINCELPENALHKGFLRTCRVEDRSRRFGSLDLDPCRGWDSESQTLIAKVFATIFNNASNAPEDFEYAERKGQILLPRLNRDLLENEKFINHGSKIEMQPFVQNRPNGRILKLEVTKPGLLDSIIFRDDEDSDLPIPGGWVEVQPQAYGINFRDVMSAMGQLDEKQELGVESAGVITRVGPNCSGLQPGTRVIALTPHGHISARVRVPWHNVVTIPEDMEFSEAASVAAVFATAYYSMFDVARVEEGETMLVHAAAGGVGQACIILAQWKGIRVLATVGSAEKRDFLIHTYGLPNEHIFSSRDESFVSGVLDATNQQGVDVVINSLAGPLLNATWDIVAQHGRFVEIGKRDIHSNKALEMRPFRKAVGFTAVDLVQLCDTRGHIVQRVLVAVMNLMKTRAIGNISPVVKYPISDIARAFRTMQAGKHMGKIVVVPNANDMVKTLPRTEVARLPSNASYLIIGGLGGIGRAYARWMVEHGGKHLILLSRSAANGPNSSSLKMELSTLGAQIMLKNCDAADMASLKTVLAECNESMPPVRGIVHGGMVLHDSILERMTYTQWTDALAAKVTATKHLHDLFPRAEDLDFFIILSSAFGVIGSASQANYTAGGTFQDAVARQRAAAGMPCVTIDLGMVDGVGYVAENKAGVADRLLSSGHRQLTEHDLLQLLDYCVRHPLRTPRTAQIITGLASSAVRKQSWGKELRFAALADDGASRGDASAVKTGSSTRCGTGLKDRLRNASTVEEGSNMVEKAVIEKLADMFVIPEQDIDATKPLAQYGVDSLVAVELRNWLVPMTQCEMSIFDLLGASSLKGLATSIATRTASTK